MSDSSGDTSSQYSKLYFLLRVTFWLVIHNPKAVTAHNTQTNPVESYRSVSFLACKLTASSCSGPALVPGLVAPYAS